ncbi:hypothetical protein SIL73_13620 [Acidithiobacillus thiooxidans]|nr:hypothetical protein [Acidithiobacillus thiooxidans]MDX5935714.1 hypothetical protein [Acidithiobacillus thiooxidans]
MGKQIVADHLHAFEHGLQTFCGVFSRADGSKRACWQHFRPDYQR